MKKIFKTMRRLIKLIYIYMNFMRYPSSKRIPLLALQYIMEIYRKPEVTTEIRHGNDSSMHSTGIPL
jgi:hypothetical protein